MQKQKQKLSTRIKKIFTQLCSPTPQSSNLQESISSSKCESKQKKKQIAIIQKQPLIRQTLKLDSVFFKESRKNIVDEQFQHQALINWQLQQHICERLSKINTALVKGEFSRQTIKKIMNPIIITDGNINLAHHSKQHLAIKAKLNCFRPQTIDTLIYQTSFSMQKQKNMKKHMMSFGTSSEALELHELMHYCNFDNFVVICSKLILEKQLAQIFEEHTDRYLFEIERVRLNQQIYCYLIYGSKNIDFLKVNHRAFIGFVVEELGISIKKTTYGERVSNEKSKIEFFQQMLEMLIANGFGFETVKVLKSVKKYYLNRQTIDKQSVMRGSSTVKQYLEEFVVKMGEEYEQSRFILEQYRQKIVGKEFQLLQTITFMHEPTPKFDIDQ